MRIAILLGSLTLVACGGSSSPPETPINLTSAGVSNSSVTLVSGGQVHFFNKDTVDHQLISSNCTTLSTKRLTPGTDDLRPPLTGPLSCTYTDALTSSGAFSGSVNVSAPGASGGGGRGY